MQTNWYNEYNEYNDQRHPKSAFKYFRIYFQNLPHRDFSWSFHTVLQIENVLKVCLIGLVGGVTDTHTMPTIMELSRVAVVLIQTFLTTNSQNSYRKTEYKF
jgi:hypothetical protein